MDKPEPVPAVAYRGHMVPLPGYAGRTGYQPENHRWRDILCDCDEDGRLIGRDPMAIEPATLTASGFPPSSARQVVQRLRHMHGVDQGEARHDGFLGIDPKHFPRRI